MDADTLERLGRLEDERAILDTLYRYAHSIDYKLEGDWLDCFTDDGVWETRHGPLASAGAGERRFHGTAELHEVFATFGGPPTIWRKHMLVEPRIEIDGDRCRVDSYLFVLCAHPTGSYVRTFGRYRDRMVRCADGRWRFEHRTAEVDGTHPLAEPLAGPDVSQLLTVEQIKGLKARFCDLVDAKRWPELAELLTEDARAWLGLPHDERVLEGREKIVSLVSRMVADFVTVHEVTTPEVEITGPTSARGTWRTSSITRMPAESGGETAHFLWGRQEEEYERGVDGRWRIRSLRLTALHHEQR